MGQSKKHFDLSLQDEIQKQYADDEYQYWYYISKKMSIDEIISNTFTVK